MGFTKGDFRPYPIDWRFLPEPILIAKDCVRRAVMISSNLAAIQTPLTPLWRATVGQETLKAIRKAGFLFIHIPKTAGTSISSLLYRKNLPPYTAQFYDKVFGCKLCGVPSFAVIRHPLDRLVSNYNMAVNGGTEIMAYDRFETLKLRGLESFGAYVDYIHVNRSRLSSLPTGVRDQAGFVQDHRGQTMVDRLFAMDRIKGPPDELGKWLGVRNFPHLNATMKQRAELSPGDLRKVDQIYERDFDLYRSLA